MNFLGQYMIHPKETLEEEIRFSFNNRKPLIVFDESGELFRKTAGSAEKAGYAVVRINFANPKESDGWNPFVMFRETMKKQGSAEAVDNVHRFVQNMLNSFHQGRYDMFCSEIEESLLNGLFLYVAFSDNLRGREDKRHLGTAIEIFLNFRTKDGQGLAEPEFFDFIENLSDEDLAKADFQMFRKLWGMAGGLQRNIITDLSTQLWFVGGNYGILLSSNDVDFISPSMGTATLLLVNGQLQSPVPFQEQSKQCRKSLSKLDSEIFNKAINAYVADPKKNLANLSKCAKDMGVYTKLMNVMEVLLNG